MDRMIELQIVPAQIEIRKTDPKIEYVNASVQQEMKRHEGGMNIQTRPTKVNVDTYACRSSIGPSFQKVGDHVKASANKGMSAAQSATAKYASRGRVLNQATPGQEPLINFSRQDSFKDVKMNVGLDFIPKVQPEVNVVPGDISIQFQQDQLQFDWKMSEQELRFTPGSVQVEMVQRPDVIVRYVGGPVYVPKSSDPNYSG